jgi:hypothetical protein
MIADAGTIERHQQSAQHQRIWHAYWEAVRAGLYALSIIVLTMVQLSVCLLVVIHRT